MDYRPGLGYSTGSGPAVGGPINNEYLNNLLPRSGNFYFGNVNMRTFPQLGAYPGEVGPGNTPGGVGGINGPIYYGVNTPEARNMSGVNGYSARSNKMGKKRSVKNTGKKYKFIKIKNSPKSTKKYTAVFQNRKTGGLKNIHFGARGMSDYTKHRDKARKDRYLKRHRANENWNNLMSAGALSRWVLWNKQTRKASIADYKRRFNKRR